MKQILRIVLLLLVSGYLAGELLSKIGTEDSKALQLIKGQWLIDDRDYVFEFTGHFACTIDGLKYYHYKRDRQRDRYPLIYTIIKSQKTGRQYFARGRYQDGRFYGSTSRIAFMDKNHFTVYLSTNPKKIYFQATRIRQSAKDG